MHYEKQTFVNGEVLTAEQLNHMEEGITAVACIASNPNLLDNCYFVDPINQRGKTDYSAGLSVDRWVFSTDDTAAIASLTPNGISIYSNGSYTNFEQNIEPIVFEKDRVYTMSFLCVDASKVNQVYQCTYKDGNNYYGTGIRGYRDNNLYSLTFTPSISGSKDGISYCGVQAIKGEQLTIIAAKLEFGSQQTLVRKENGVWVLNDPPPNKQQELAKCQRHCLRMFLRVPPGKSYISFPVTLRATPTIHVIQSEDGLTSFEAGNVTNHGCIVTNADSTYVRTFEALFTSDL